MSHVCPDCGLEHESIVIEEAASEPATAAAVEIAEIEANRDVKLAQINAGTEEAWRDARIAELQGEIRGMREMMEKLLPPEPDPEPEPIPVVVEPAAAEPVTPEPAVEPPPAVEPIAKQTKSKSPWW